MVDHNVPLGEIREGLDGQISPILHGKGSKPLHIATWCILRQLTGWQKMILSIPQPA